MAYQLRTADELKEALSAEPRVNLTGMSLDDFGTFSAEMIYRGMVLGLLTTIGASPEFYQAELEKRIPKGIMPYFERTALPRFTKMNETLDNMIKSQAPKPRVKRINLPKK